jgi:V/A-type H+-transporting ATPase subunit E
MTIELQHLIETVRREAVEEAQARADAILAEARQKAQAIVREAEAKADSILDQAETDAQRFTEKSTRTLEQTARDLIILVGEAVEVIFADMVAEETAQAMTPETLARCIESVCTRFAEAYPDASLDVVVSPEDHDTLVAYFRERYTEALGRGVELRASPDVLRGFRIAFRDRAVYLDFTSEAVADSLAQLLRPRLAEIVRCAARSSVDEACNLLDCRQRTDGTRDGS